MAKKRFTAGMESLFGDMEDQDQLDQGALMSEQKKTSKEPEKGNRKGFRDNLKAFLQEAFEESLETQLEQRKEEKKLSSGDSKQATKKSQRPKGGLDALLRSTIEPTKIKLQNKPLRRLTISFDERKLDKLKSIARNKKIYLKDIIDEIVGDYLEGYDTNKGSTD